MSSKGSAYYIAGIGCFEKNLSFSLNVNAGVIDGELAIIIFDYHGGGN